MPCPSCGYENGPSSRFCVNCGARLEAACATCGKPLSPNSRFCAECGTKVAGTSPAAKSAQAPAAKPAAKAAPTETALFLAKVSVFQYLRPEVLESLATQMRLVSFPEGPIFKEKDSADGLYIIQSGAARVSKSAEGGTLGAVLAILKRGDSFGELGLIDGLPRSADVTAMQPVQCYFLGREAFLTVLKDHTEIAQGMLKALAGMVRNADEWVARRI